MTKGQVLVCVAIAFCASVDFGLEWTSGPVAPAPGAIPVPDDGPSIFAALQEQLGLRLEAGRETFDVVIVDVVHRPTPD